MADTFTWSPTVANYSGSTTQRVRKSQFGDGYTQRVADGLNSEVSSFNVQFIGDAATIQAILAFFTAHTGISFNWTPPLWTAPALFACEKYSQPSKDGASYTISATFDQTFAP
jgi:phage-related protein